MIGDGQSKASEQSKQKVYFCFGIYITWLYLPLGMYHHSSPRHATLAFFCFPRDGVMNSFNKRELCEAFFGGRAGGKGGDLDSTRLERDQRSRGTGADGA